MSRFARLANELSRKMENYAAAEATRLRKSNRGKLRLIGIAICILVVILLALWIGSPVGPLADKALRGIEHEERE